MSLSEVKSPLHLAGGVVKAELNMTPSSPNAVVGDLVATTTRSPIKTFGDDDLQRLLRHPPQGEGRVRSNKASY